VVAGEDNVAYAGWYHPDDVVIDVPDKLGPEYGPASYIRLHRIQIVKDTDSKLTPARR
jgi:hypothetical protein